MPIAGGGDWQCLSGQDPLPRLSPHLGTLRRVGWGAEGFGTFWLMEGPDATWPTSQSITACVEAGSRGSGGRNFSLGRHGSRCAPISHACHLQWPNHLPKRACPRPLLTAGGPAGSGRAVRGGQEVPRSSHAGRGRNILKSHLQTKD